ncbi:hypothetical protein LY28_02519 [Ruminiclostridium sufflavum DSM 19573]|uniref:Uncharacterized protein n=1 Tax=Ruminiclostridium sufflavum DSM 19573 TaxID=1121337 RepID=A0A318XMM7_9FIRM|nr:hypothetical protein [Ruminiclostridium sufflavum]PYG86899.1 hypothetical protein LY28_02519 [Ruminiclostridium sufflavum DSM 19573]
MNLLLVCIAFICIAALEVPYMVKNKQWYSLTVYSVLLVSVFVLGALVASGIKVPSPIKAAQAFYKDILGLSFKSP